MTDTGPAEDNCRSRRCRQIGRCNCLHVYDDGTLVPGAGTASNPYVHATNPIVCVLESNGVALTPDAARCVTLPDSAQAIELLDGTILTPNVNGVVFIPDAYLREFSFSDTEGTTLTVTDGANIAFEIDGGAQQGYVQQGINYPIISGSSIVLPGEKGIYADQGNLFALPPVDVIRFSATTGAAQTVTTMTPQIFGPLEKQTHLRVSVGLGIADLSGASPTPGANEVIRYEVSLRMDTIPNTGFVDQVVGRGYWSPNGYNGYIHDTYVADVFTEDLGLDVMLPMYVSVRVQKSIEVNNPNRDVYAECQLAIQWD